MVTSYNSESETMTENRKIVIETIEELISNISSAIFSMISVFVICNIPTVILLSIYTGYRRKKRKNLELKKMNI